jgi:hypothetical protein
MNSLRPILVELDRPGSIIVYNTITKQANLHGASTASLPVSADDLLTLFQNAWIARYESHEGEHRYRITEIGREVSRE